MKNLETLLKGNMVYGELVNLVSGMQNSIVFLWLGLSLGFKGEEHGE